MLDKVGDKQRLEQWFGAFFPIGALPDGSVTRLGYTAEEDEMHDMFASLAREMGLEVYKDAVGNTFAARNMEEPYVLVGSHLDSVVQGGRYDGVVGVLAGLLILALAGEMGLKTPIRAAAFRCEESSNFGCATIGSGLVTGALSPEKAGGYLGRDGVSFAEVMERRGHSLTAPPISGLKAYYEVHIEQGKVLEETGDRVGIVTSIAGPRRFAVDIKGLAEHSGATPMEMRADALCAACEVILAVEAIGAGEPDSVATVGVIHNTPNALNVIPGETKLGVDLRSCNTGSLDRMEKAVRERVDEICRGRAVTAEVKATSGTAPVKLSEALSGELCAAAEKLGVSWRKMPSGAGHDAMEFPPFCDTAMVFIPCEKGISHNGLEKASLEDLRDAAYVVFEAIMAQEKG